ncbi:MAG: hypothetical protein LBO79_10545 [Zoogloeaceae bacterium]|jgi:type II secretory pathway pseudopilin PulG|nr:hypothetical protein [Zoogloeaceae bacterium]
MANSECLTTGKHRQTGFSYLWVLLLVALMGVSLTVAVEVDSIVVRRDQEKALLAIGRQFQSAIGRYYESMPIDGRNEYPASLEDLLQDPRYPGTVRHLRRIFVDPVMGKAEWGLVKIGGRIVGVYSLSAKMPIKQANFEAEVSHFANARKYSDWIFAYPPDLVARMDAQQEEGVEPADFPANGITDTNLPGGVSENGLAWNRRRIAVNSGSGDQARVHADTALRPGAANADSGGIDDEGRSNRFPVLGEAPIPR